MGEEAEDDLCRAITHDGREDDCDDFEDDGSFDCGLGADGQCSLAGSEWCDFDCGRLG